MLIQQISGCLLIKIHLVYSLLITSIRGAHFHNNYVFFSLHFFTFLKFFTFLLISYVDINNLIGFLIYIDRCIYIYIYINIFT